MQTFSLRSQIKNENISEKILFPYNLTNIFTNIPFRETIDIAINFIFHHVLNVNITLKKLKKLSLSGTSQTHFCFKSKFYNQTNEAVLDSPLDPVLVRIFIAF